MIVNQFIFNNIFDIKNNIYISEIVLNCYLSQYFNIKFNKINK